MSKKTAKCYGIILGIIIIFAICLGLIAPWGIGKILQNVAISRIESFTKANPQYEVKLKDYNRGIYKSTSIIEVTYKLPNDSAKSDHSTILKIQLENSIQHGPIVLDSDTKNIDFVLAKISNQIKFQETPRFKLEQDSLNMQSVINYSGKQSGSTSYDKISGLIKKDENDPKSKLVFFELNNIAFDFSWHLKEQSPSYQLKINDSKIDLGNSEIQLSGFVIKNNITRRNDSNLSYTCTVSLDKFEMPVNVTKDRMTNANSLSINNINLQFDSRLEKGVFFTNAKGNFKEAKAKDFIFGPGEFDYAVDGLNENFIKDLANLNSSSSTSSQSPEQNFNMIIQMIKDNHLDLKIALKTFKLNLPGGELSLCGSYNVKIDEKSKDKDFVMDGKLALMVPKQEAYQIAKMMIVPEDPTKNPEDNVAMEQLSAMIRDGFIVDTGKQFESYLLFKNGELFRNGIPSAESVYLDSFGSLKRPVSKDIDLLAAIWLEDVDKVKELLKEGVIPVQTHKDVKNPLQIAAFMGNKKIVDLLLGHKVPVDQTDHMGNTALSLASRRGHIEIVKDLLSKGAQAEVSNIHGWTPLQEAAENGHLLLVKLLLENKVDINKADKESRTALFWAAQKGHEQIVEFLLNKGADPKIASTQGRTPRDTAKSSGHERIVEILTKAMESQKLTSEHLADPNYMRQYEMAPDVNKDREGLGGDTSFIQFLSPQEVKTGFQDVGGLIELKEEVKELIDFLKNPKKFLALGAEMPKGVLLVGPPGAGKTLIARAIAGEAKVSFLSVSGPDFQNGWIGTGAWRVKKLFEKARENAPAIIFIDEIDSLLAHRKYAGLGGEQEYVAAVNQFLAELDGVDKNKNMGIIVMGATNQISALDKAAIRAGRFDRHLYFNLPTQQERLEILNIVAKKMKLKNSVNLKLIAQTSTGFSGADLKNLMNEAAINAATENKSAIDDKSVDFARDKILLGKQRPALVLNEKQKKTVAYHEAGHALIGQLLKQAPIEKISIIPRGQTLGVTLLCPTEDHLLESKEYYEGMIAQALGGYVAESLIFGEGKVTEGSEDDLRKATEIANAMVTRWGFSERGPIYQLESFDDSAVEKEVQTIIKKQQAVTKNLLEKNVEKLHNLAKALIKEENLSAKQVKNIID